MVILTPYYQTVLNRKYNECVEEPDYNFNSYNLFCLKTRLLPRVQKILGYNVDILYGSTQTENKNVIYTNVTLVKYRIGAEKNQVELNLNENIEEVSITDDQKKQIQKDVDEITTKDSDACLLMSFNENITDDEGKTIPIDWLEKIIPYVSIDGKLNSFVNDNGLHLVLTAYTKADVPYTYSEKYNQVLIATRNQVISMYKAGYIYIYPDEHRDKLVHAWDLETVDDDGYLYRPRWFDLRITNDLVKFIQSRMRGERVITVQIGNNFVNRHFVADMFQNKNYTFNFENILIYVSNLTEARQSLAMLFNALNNAKGTVYTYIFTDRDTLMKYVEEKEIDLYVIYKTEDRLKPYTLSILEEK